MNGLFFFIVLPYVAIFSLLLGSIYRYRYHGFQVSSLSSQFLESKQLSWGSRPFHWGIITLFFGHLIGFLTPRAVIAWNGVPIRLYILEVTALAFGLMTLIGLTLLIIRRIQVKRLHIGLYTAYFFRWGSSWFAMVLTPYLWSIFTFSPDTAAVVALPIMVKIHIISAYVLIGMIPFTRFIHFLVYPFTYYWRSPQVVMWNYRRTIKPASAKKTGD